MLFTLEALNAKHGDALLLHYGTAADPTVALIDGGPAGVFNKSVKPRLEELRTKDDPDAVMNLPLVMVSHIDDDHVNGILQFFGQLADLKANGRQRPYEIDTLWHNSFDDILGNGADELMASIAPAAMAAAADTPMPADLPISRAAGLVLASVRQGRDLRNHANAIGIEINTGFANLVMVPPGKKEKAVAFDDLKLRVIGPHQERVVLLQEEWDKQIKKLGVARIASFTDESVFNLSSIVTIAEIDGRQMLLTGDARGDHIIEGLKTAGLFKDDGVHFDLLKIPHHGSDHNVSTEFFRDVRADHYVFSGDGKHGNPELATIQMLLNARNGDAFTMYFTNKEKRLVDFFAGVALGGAKVIYRDDGGIRGVTVDLGDETLS
jgi:hypothetical protein